MVRILKYIVLAAAAFYAMRLSGFELKAALVVSLSLFAFGILRVAAFLVDVLLVLIVVGILGYHYAPPDVRNAIRAGADSVIGSVQDGRAEAGPETDAAPAATP